LKRLAPAFATAFAILSLAGAALADVPRARIQGEEDERLLAELRGAVGETREAPTSRLDARRRATEAAELAAAVLRSEGYYQAELEPTVSDDDPPQAVLVVRPGHRFVFGPTVLQWIGPPPADETQASAQAAVLLEPGSPGRAQDVLAAEGRVVVAIQGQGYPDATARPREVIVDHADTTVRPTFRIEAGQLVLMDGIRLTTEGRTKARYVEGLVPWRAGDKYSPESIAELERRLLDVGVYDSVTVALAPADQNNAAGQRPVIVSLADRPPRSIELGVGYSTTEGAGMDARWTHYNRFGRFDTLTFLFRLAEIQQKLDAELSLPHWRRPNQRLRLGGGFVANQTDAFDDYDVGVRIDVERRWRQTSYVTVGLAADYNATFDRTVTNPDWQNLFIITGLGAFNLDRSDNALDPRRGWRVEARAEPTGIAGDVSLVYLKAQVQGSYYWPISNDTVLAVRGRIGSILGGRLPDVPASRRLYAGGGGSVRGYAYQGVGPRLVDNTPAGGLSLVETSVEVRQHIVGPWSAAFFVDAGTVGTNQAPDFDDLSAAVGAGVRYNLGFGPIRFDVAVPLNPRQGDPDFQIYISIGQAF
jgi:translocation and assembly module TamA